MIKRSPKDLGKNGQIGDIMTIKTREEIVILREGGRRLAQILQKVVQAAKPGVSTFDLDRLAEELIFSSGGKPAFKGYRIRETRSPYPASLCVSTNDEVVHGIPRKDRIFKDGDVVGLDIGMQWPASAKATAGKPVSQMSNVKGQMSGLYTDMAVTIGIGKISSERERLLRLTRESLDIGINEVKPGAQVGDIGYAIECHLKKHGLGVVRDLGGHGVGYELHEEPLIPNYGRPHSGPELKEGMVIAIEPMATLGDWRVVLDRDEWTFRTADGSLAAHFEHTVAVTKSGGEILTRH